MSVIGLVIEIRLLSLALFRSLARALLLAGRGPCGVDRSSSRLNGTMARRLIFSTVFAPVMCRS
jgi:hypothetical protein